MEEDELKLLNTLRTETFFYIELLEKTHGKKAPLLQEIFDYLDDATNKSMKRLYPN